MPGSTTRYSIAGLMVVVVFAAINLTAMRDWSDYVNTGLGVVTFAASLLVCVLLIGVRRRASPRQLTLVATLLAAIAAVIVTRYRY